MVPFFVAAVRTCIMNPACASLVRDGMALGLAVAVTTKTTEGFDIAESLPTLPGFAPETSSPSTHTTPEHKESPKTLATPEHAYIPSNEGFDAYDKSVDYGAILQFSKTDGKFRSEDEYKAHYDKHRHEWNSVMSQQEYLERAQNLSKMDERSHILVKHRVDNGDILKYNQHSNELVVITKDGVIRTFFKPKDGIKYWEKLK